MKQKTIFRSTNFGWMALIIGFVVSHPGRLTKAEVVVNYAIGNSLTGDLTYGFPGKGLDALTAGTSNATSTGVHILSGQTLTSILQNPDHPDVITNSYGRFPTAFNTPISNFFLQPSRGATVAQEIQAIKSFIDLARQNPANANSRFFINASWGPTLEPGSGESYYDVWRSFEATLDGGMIASKSTFDLIMSELRATGYEVGIVPAGHAWFATIEAIRNGVSIEMISRSGGVLTPYSLTEAELWRDPIHANHPGAFIGGLSAYSAIYGTEPIGLDPLKYSMQEFIPTSTYLSPNGARTLEQITWNAYLTAIPEPNTWGLVIVSLVQTCAFKRRRA